MKLVELLGQLGERIHEVEAGQSELGESAFGQLDTDAGDVRIKLTLLPGFPYTPPRVEILEEEVPSCPPLMPDGSLCWQDAADLLVDHSRPLAVLEYCLVQVRRLLDQALNERSWSDIMSEYGSYWAHRCGEFLFLADGSPGIEPVTLERTPGPIRILRPNPASIDAVLVPLREGALPMPPKRGMTVGWVREHLFELLPAESRTPLLRLLDVQGRKFRRVVFRIPRRNGLPLYLGVRFKCGRGKGHPLFVGKGSATVAPFYARIWDEDFFRERGGADLTLKKSKVLVVGCGAVGGHIALDLARSGVGHLVLVDPDTHSAENAFRHALGLGVPFINKAAQLAAHIVVSYPGARAEPLPLTVEEALAGGALDLTSFDAAVIAVDRPAGTQALNEAAWEAGQPHTVVHAWLEAYGLASHVMRTHPGTPGCFECLVRDRDTGSLTENLAHLAGPGQDFFKDQAGCGGRYVPFGAVHASRTAVMAVEEVLRGLRGEREPKLVTWRGNPDPFIEAGYRLSDRGRRWDEQRVVDIARADRVANPSCPVCRP